MYGSAISFIAMAVMTRTGMPGALERILEGEAVHHGRQHADVVAGRAVHAARRGGQAAEDVAAADDDADLDAQGVDLGDLARDERAERRVHAVLAIAEEGLAGQLEQDPAVAEPALDGGRHRPPLGAGPATGLGHSSSPSA